MTGVPASTIATWAAADGLVSEAPSVLASWAALDATEARVTRMHARKVAAADRILDDITRLRAELFAPTVDRELVDLGNGGSVVVDVDRPVPRFADQLQLMVAIGKAVDAVLAMSGPLVLHGGVARDSPPWWDEPGHR